MSKQVANVQLMQKMNRLRVLNYIRRNPDASRPIIAERTGLSLASITNVTSYLMDIGLLVESGIEPTERVGRKSTMLRFCAEAYGLIIASLSEEIADIFYTDMEGNILSRVSLPVAGLSSEGVITLVRKGVAELTGQYGNDKTAAVGIFFSGLVLNGNRFVVSSSMKWKEMDIKKIFEEDTGLPVFVENISRLRAVWYSSSNKETYEKNVVFVDLENGIGAVQVYKGAVPASVLGEIGHTTVEKDGLSCFCGNKGCLEAMCSSERLEELYASTSGHRASAKDIDTFYAEGDIFAAGAVTECGKYLGIGLANLISIFNPALLVINRGQFAGCQSVIREAVDEMSNRVYPALIQEMDVCYVEIDLEQTVRGAAFEMCDRMFDISFDSSLTASSAPKNSQ